jgi:hypothetical protein
MERRRSPAKDSSPPRTSRERFLVCERGASSAATGTMPLAASEFRVAWPCPNPTKDRLRKDSALRAPVAAAVAHSGGARAEN